MQGLRLAAITDVEKTKLRRKICQSQWTVKYGSRSVGQGACLKGVKDNYYSRVTAPWGDVAKIFSVK